MDNKHKIVLLADPVLLLTLKAGLSREPEVDIQFTASQSGEIISFLEKKGPTAAEMIVISDFTVPVADSSFISALNKLDVPLVAIVASVNDGFRVLEQGASDMIVHRATNANEDIFFYRMLIVHVHNTVQQIETDKQRINACSTDPITGKIIALGSSTGGTETVLEILKQMPADVPPILVVQHMPPVFTKMYADRANHLCEINVREARDGDRIANGLALIAPGDFHMTLVKKNDQFYVECKKGERVCGQCPSVDVLFHSVAQTAKANAVGVILTGMGADGAEGLYSMRQNGAYTIGQDEETSIVYGMPRAAYERGAVISQQPLYRIPREILDHAR